MDFNWIILDNIIFGYDLNFVNSYKSSKNNKIYLFDLDNTIIKTKSGKVFPLNKDDWLFLNNTTEKTINNLFYDNSNIVGIVTNQGGLKNKQLIDNWIDKIKSISKKLKFSFIFASIKNDNFRKPLPSSWDYIKSNLLQGIPIQFTKKNIYYIGDAFGRKEDHSDTDLKYAINCGFKFKTPEVFFKYNLDDINSKSGTITYPNIFYYSEQEQNILFESIFKHINKGINQNNNVLIVLIGYPASGKSFLRKQITNKFTEFVYNNNDDVNDKIIDNKLVKINDLTSYKYIINDNTNTSLDSRKKFMSSFKNYYKIGIWFNYDFDINKHLNYMRMFWFGGKLISPVIYRTLAKKFTKPELDEGFNQLFEIDKVFHQFDYSNKIQYYF